MEIKFLMEYFEKKIPIKVNLKNGYFYRGYILKIEGKTILFLDKNNEKIPIDTDSISYIVRDMLNYISILAKNFGVTTPFDKDKNFDRKKYLRTNLFYGYEKLFNINKIEKILKPTVKASKLPEYKFFKHFNKILSKYGITTYGESTLKNRLDVLAKNGLVITRETEGKSKTKTIYTLHPNMNYLYSKLSKQF